MSVTTGDFRSFKASNFLESPSPSSDSTWKTKKFAFDQTANLAHIPVAKRIQPFGR